MSRSACLVLRHDRLSREHSESPLDTSVLPTARHPFHACRPYPLSLFPDDLHSDPAAYPPLPLSTTHARVVTVLLKPGIYSPRPQLTRRVVHHFVKKSLPLAIASTKVSPVNLGNCISITSVRWRCWMSAHRTFSPTETVRFPNSSLLFLSSSRDEHTFAATRRKSSALRKNRFAAVRHCQRSQPLF